jgi:glucosylceramidase
MYGFGGAICDNSAYVFDNYLTEEARKELFNKLFGSEGIRLNYLRMIMGSTDNSFEWYTYDDMPEGETDENMEHFSMEKDEFDVIPYFQRAKIVNPDLMILGSPCSPPAWMKTSKHLFTGSVEPHYYPALAKYFVKYIQTMEKCYGLPVEAITIQNEPLYEQYVPNPLYPNMLMKAKDQATFIKTALGPAFERDGITTKIISFDHNWDLWEYGRTILDDPDARKYVAGTGFHCYGGGPEQMKNVYEKYPEKEIYHTECSLGGWGDQNFPDIMKWLVGEIFMGNIENYIGAVLLWYLSTDENSGPVTNGCPSCRGFVTVDSKTGAITYNPEYYFSGHFSKFVDKGAYRIFSTDTKKEEIRNVAFMNPDGSKVLVVLNSSPHDKTIEVRNGDEQFFYVQPAQSTATYILNPKISKFLY